MPQQKEHNPDSDLDDEEIDSLRNNPKFKKLFKDMLLESFDGNDEDMSRMKRKMALQLRKPGKKTGVSKGTRVPKVAEKIKSPSDMTIYAPALQRHNDAGLNHRALANKSPQGSPQFVQPQTLLVGRQPSSQPESGSTTSCRGKCTRGGSCKTGCSTHSCRAISG